MGMSVLRACGAISTRFVPCLPRYSKRERGRGGRTLISFDLVAPLRRSDTRNFPSFVLGRTSTVYLSTLSSLLALTLPPACSPDRFVTTTGSAYKGHTFRRRNSHPALDARENNPQSTVRLFVSFLTRTFLGHAWVRVRMCRAGTRATAMGTVSSNAPSVVTRAQSALLVGV